MKVRFKLFANFREAVGKKDLEADVPGNTVKEVIHSLVGQHPKLAPLMYQDGELKQYVNVLLNGQTVKHDLIHTTVIKEGDEIALFPPVSGG
jgi:molybdopterin synthase sulfur carrier subunit